MRLPKSITTWSIKVSQSPVYSTLRAKPDTSSPSNKALQLTSASALRSTTALARFARQRFL
jgi:hypothetical protein